MIYQVHINLLLWWNYFSVTETFVLGRQFLSQNFISNRIFYSVQKCVSMMENWTKTCLCDGNLFSERNLCSVRNFCLTESYFCDMNFFSVTEVCFCDRKFFSVTESFFLSQKLVSMTNTCSVQKNTLWAFFTWFPGSSFCFSDNQDNHFVEPCMLVAPTFIIWIVYFRN